MAEWMKYLAFAAAIIIAIIYIIKEFLDKPRDPRKILGWRLALIASFLVLILVLLKWPDLSDDGTLTRQDIAAIVGDTVGSYAGSYECEIDSLVSLVTNMASTTEQRDEHRRLAKEYAVCLKDIAKTGVDSGIVALGLGQFNNAITHANYAIQAAKTDSIKAKAYFLKAIAFHLYADHSIDDNEKTKGVDLYMSASLNYDSVLRFNPNDSDASFFKGYTLQKAGFSKEAIESYRAASHYSYDDTSMCTIWKRIGDLQDEIGYREEAVSSYNKALTYRDDCVTLYGNLGVTLDKIGRHSEALANFNKVILLDSSYSPGWFGKGITTWRLGITVEELKDKGTSQIMYDSALHCFDEALRLGYDPGHAWAMKTIALVYLKRYKEAEESCDSAINHSDSLHALYGLRNLLDSAKSKGY